MSTTRIGIIGLGRMGERHARVITGLAGAAVAWTADPAIANAHGQHAHFADWRSALERDLPDAVVVATPTTTHREIAMVLLSAGVPVLVEKPLAATTSEAASLVRAAASDGRVLAVGHVERFNPAVEAVRRLLDDGSLGQPISLSFRRVGLPPRSTPDADVLSDLAVHDLDVLAMLLGTAPVLRGASVWPGSGFAEAAQLLLNAGDVSASLQVNWRTPTRIREFSITTDTCLVEVNYTTQAVEVVEAIDEQSVESFSRFQSSYGELRRTRLEVTGREPLVGELEGFLAAVRGTGAGVLADGAAGLLAVRLAEEARAMSAIGSGRAG